MPITRQRTLHYLEHEWGTYIERFHRLSPAEAQRRVNAMGYQRFRDMLAHILAWWEEGMEIVRAIAANREFERKQYDFDVFNAEAVAKYQDWDEAAFLQRFEAMRQTMAADLGSMAEAVFENRRVKSWLNGIVYHHAREHLVLLSRFLVVDLLENEWAEYVARFQKLEAEKQQEFLAKQGFASLYELLAHIIGWWEEGARIIGGIMDSPSFTWEPHDTDAFNRELTEKYASWTHEDLLAHYETVRRAMLDLITDLPDDAFLNTDIEGWLRDDVVSHYDDHPLPL